MKLMEFLNKKAVSVDLKSRDKKGIINEMVDLIMRTGEVKPKDKDAVVKILLDREMLGSTGIGQEIGIPHGKSKLIRRLIGAVGISKKGIDFDSLDGEPAHIFFLLLAPQESAGPHLKALARISRLLKDKFFRDLLRNSTSDKELLTTISREDQKQH